MAETSPGGSSKPQSAEMHGGPGFRVRTAVSRPDPELVKAFTAFEGAMVSDLMNRLYTMRREIHPIVPFSGVIAGPACTVKVFPGDNLMAHAALDIAQPGDIVVIDAGSSPMNAVIGDLVAMKAKHRGIAGFIVDGLVRDVAGIEAAQMPVFARGVTPVGPLHRGPGEVNHPVQCGGVVVFPGDIVVADRDGVVVIPRESGPELLARCIEKSGREADYVEAVARGEFSNEWVQEALHQADCVIEG